MIKVGIDFSINSPSLVIYKDGCYKFISFFNDFGKDWKKSKAKSFMYHNLLKDIIELVPYTRHVDNTNYRTSEASKMKGAIMMSNIIIDKLKQEIGDEEVSIAIEGFSFGSKNSSSTLDLALYNSFLRRHILEEFGEDSLVVISPTEGKKTLYGKGNANKDNMIDSFIANRLKDEDLTKCDFWKFCSRKKLDYKNIKPIDDLVDSYAILKSNV